MPRDPRWFVKLEAFLLASPWPGLPDRRAPPEATRVGGGERWRVRVSLAAAALASAIASALSGI